MIPRVMRVLVAILAVVAPGAAHAGLTRHELVQVGFEDRTGAALPLDAVVTELDKGNARLSEILQGRPALVLFADYGCQTLCGVMANQLALALGSVPLQSNSDYRVLVIGLDRRRSIAEARTFRAERVAQSPIAASFHYVLGSGDGVQSLIRAAGLRTAYDRERDQVAHPAGVLLVTPQARIARILDAVALSPFDLRLALAEAADGHTAPLAEKALLLCYGWDAATGMYTLQVRRILTAAGLVTVAALGTALFLLLRRERRGASGGGHA